MRCFRFAHPLPYRRRRFVKTPSTKPRIEKRAINAGIEGKLPRRHERLKFLSPAAAQKLACRLTRPVYCRTCAETRFKSSCSSFTPRTSRSVLRKARTIASMSLVLESFLPPLNLAVEARLSR